MTAKCRRLIRVTEHNVDKVFKFFCEKVLKKSNKISANDLVALFFGCITDHENYYLHPSKKNILVAERLGNISVNSDVYNALMSTFAKTTSPKEKARLAALSDRLIEDTNRRRKGEFYTPTNFVDYSHGMIAEKFGENWTDEYVVWDCACGTKNLTRDKKFKELYCSTLEQAELDVSKQYNPEATSFVFDFLNGSDEELFQKAPGLKAAFEQNKKIIFFINPPYSNSGGMNGEGNGFAKKSFIKSEMVKDNISGEEIYAQFLYRIVKFKEKFRLTNLNIALFCKPKFLTGESFKEFRAKFLKNFKFENGIYFNAGHFANVSATWGITFNIWTSGETIDKNNFEHIVVDVVDDEIKNKDKKCLYNADSAKLFKTLIPKLKKTAEFPNWRKANVIDESNVKVSDNYLGCVYQGMHNAGFSILMYYKPGGYKYCITPNTISILSQFFTICELKPNAWINDKDELLIPDTTNPLYNEFVNDSIVYMSIGGGYDVSLRNVQYHNKSWNIKNEFFWMSNQEMKDLAEEYEIDEMYSDANGDSERFVYQKLQNIQLSAEAQAVLDAAKELVRKSMKYRKFFNDEHPEIQILNWDAGIYQIKKLCKEYLKDDWKKFAEIRKALANKMRPMIYELGFLRK